MPSREGCMLAPPHLGHASYPRCGVPRALNVTLVLQREGGRSLRVGLAVPLLGTTAELREMVAREGDVPPQQVMGWHPQPLWRVLCCARCCALCRVGPCAVLGHVMCCVPHCALCCAVPRTAPCAVCCAICCAVPSLAPCCAACRVLCHLLHCVLHHACRVLLCAVMCCATLCDAPCALRHLFALCTTCHAVRHIQRPVLCAAHR